MYKRYDGLYGLHNKLEKYISDKCDLGYILGLCVIEGCFSNQEIHSDEEIFKEVEKIYESINRALGKIQETEDSYKLVYSMQRSLIPEIKKLMDSQNSYLGNNIKEGFLRLIENKGKSYEETIKNSGLELITKINETGRLRKRRTVKVKDRKNILDCFTMKK